ncbi:MAG: CPBP family intramembrane metalloprotease [Ruminococcaceae bacterium]|nr:CPBP family intramembrane metalloprotease [Oscillospiraceae bacterium]
MYEEQEREDHLSLDFHTGLTPDTHFKSVVNIIAFLSFLQIVFYVGAPYIYEFVENSVYRLFGQDALMYHAVMDVWDMFEYTGSFLIPLGVVLLIFRDRVFRPYIPFAPSTPPHAVSVIFFTVAVLYLFGWISDGILTLLEEIGVPLYYYEPPLPDTPLRMFLYFISSVILPAFVEEMIFRGYILHLLLPYGKTFAIMVSAVLFGLMHLYLPQLLYATVAGILIGYFVVRGGSVWIGIFIHALNNLFAYLMDMAYVLLPDTVYEMFCTALQVVILLCGVIGALVLCTHASGDRRGLPLESGSVYDRLLDTPTALRRTMTVPMIVYLVCAVYYVIINSIAVG